jgi:N-succinyldiaminopimelate aminotransferase
MNSDIQKLQPYPFEKLQALFMAVSSPDNKSPIALSIGEPKHPSPECVLEALRDNIGRVSEYPTTPGLPALRQCIADWATRRFNLKPNSLTPESNILPVNGTREALFAFAQATISRSASATVIMPNPFYQIYEGAAYLAGATPLFIPCGVETNFLPDFDRITDAEWDACQLLFLCSPGNPTGAVIPLERLQALIQLADKHDFVIASDECYSEIYPDEANPPIGLLEACANLGRDHYERCVVFHSLSKRSNLPGLRSGFVAGDSHLISTFLKYRTYHGCSMPIHHQLASIVAWQDEAHVLENRNIYRKKFDLVLPILKDVLDVTPSEASFYLWPQTPIDDAAFAQQLYANQHVKVLPGSYLSRSIQGRNPGEGFIRTAWVATLEECEMAAERVHYFVKHQMKPL